MVETLKTVTATTEAGRERGEDRTAGARPRMARWAEDGALWIGALAGPVLWLLDLVVSYALVPTAKKSGRDWPLHAVSAAAALLTAGAAALAWRGWRRIEAAAALAASGKDPPIPIGAQTLRRARFMARFALGGAALFLLVIAATAIPKLALPPEIGP